MQTQSRMRKGRGMASLGWQHLLNLWASINQLLALELTAMTVGEKGIDGTERALLIPLFEYLDDERGSLLHPIGTTS